MRFSFSYSDKNFNVDAEEYKSIFPKACGLMFRKKSKPLLFVFKKAGKRAIHSFFCQPFVAIWFDDDKIIGVKLIKPWRFSVKPKQKFNKLLEIPSNDLFFKEFPDEENL